MARLTENFAAKFTIAPQEAESFVAPFLEKLHQKGLITMR